MARATASNDLVSELRITRFNGYGAGVYEKLVDDNMNLVMVCYVS